MRSILSLTLCMLLALSTAPVQGVQFVAEQITFSGGYTHRGSLYHRDDMWRIEHNDPGSIEVTIVRLDKGLMWLLLGRTKQFATISFDRTMGKTLERSMAHEIGRETIGSEDLDGHPTTVFQVMAREGQEDVIYCQWWAEDLQTAFGLPPSL